MYPTYGRLSRGATIYWVSWFGPVCCSRRTRLFLTPPPAVESPINEPTRARLVPYLTDLCDWIMTLDVGSGRLKNTSDTDWSVFINGDLARTVLAGYKVTTNSAYLHEALRWCDTFVEQQVSVDTSRGEAAGCWADAGATGNIYLADGGTAATAIAVISRNADGVRRQQYRPAMERYSLFVRHGCREDPQGQGRVPCSGWVIDSGKDRASLGCGYCRGHLSTAPYIISTGVNAGAFHALRYSLAQDSESARLSAGPRWRAYGGCPVALRQCSHGQRSTWELP